MAERFFLVLFPVFTLNVFCLAYIIYLTRMGELVPDFIEPQSLFTLALKSSPSQSISEDRDRELKREQVSIKWHVRQDSNSSYYVDSDAQMPVSKGYTPTPMSDIEIEDPETQPPCKI